MSPKLHTSILVLAFASICASAAAQDATTAGGPASRPAARPEFAARRAALVAEKAAAEAALAAAIEDGRAAAPALRQELELLGRLDLELGQVLAAQERGAELKASRAQLEAELEALRARGPPEPRPYPFALLEALRDQLSTEVSRAAARADAVAAAQLALESAKSAYLEVERARRQAREQAATTTDPGRAAEFGRTLRLAQLESEAAQAAVDLRELELANERLESELHALRRLFFGEKLALVRPEVRFARTELDEFLARIDEQEYRLNQALDWAKVDLAARDAAWLEVRRRAEAAAAGNSAISAEVEARRLARQVRQREITLLGQQLQALAEARVAWQRRYELFIGGAAPAAAVEWESDARAVHEQLARDIRLHSTRLEELRREAITLDAELAAAESSSPDALNWIEEQKRQLGALTRVFAETVGRLETVRRLHEKLLAEVSARQQQVTWSERLAAAWAFAREVWNYEITSVQDSPITVRKIVIGLLLFVVGAVAARFLARLFARRLLTRVGLNEGAVAAIQSLLFYVLVLTVAMLSLRVVNVPLTAFTILGGALAIGIGFGSQNVVNNFISGLILLAERPIRVGDLIQVDELVGTVEHIGPRSTRVRAPENFDIVVPNSSFLEKNVVNWTLSDDRFRTRVVVGVVYGSPTRDVARLIRKALDEHGKVLAKPEPIVLFSDFGDSALVFEAHFWVRMRRIMERRLIESDIRYRIDALFREARIVIAFPQRDVHLDAAAPLPVRLIRQRTDAPE